MPERMMMMTDSKGRRVKVTYTGISPTRKEIDDAFAQADRPTPAPPRMRSLPAPLPVKRPSPVPLTNRNANRNFANDNQSRLTYGGAPTPQMAYVPQPSKPVVSVQSSFADLNRMGTSRNPSLAGNRFPDESDPGQK